MKMDYYNFSKFVLICKIDKNFINVRRSKSSKLMLLFLFFDKKIVRIYLKLLKIQLLKLEKIKVEKK